MSYVLQKQKAVLESRDVQKAQKKQGVDWK